MGAAMSQITIFTIGYSKRSAEEFFETLKKVSVKRVIDIRLNNLSQLAGFTKKQDLPYLLREICDLDYTHMLELAPTQEILDAYRKNHGQWEDYEREFKKLIRRRKIDEIVPRSAMDGGCLLCSEYDPAICHRRLVTEYLQEKWENVEIQHIL
jgi:uncharacterized protein (DUF488 family)